MRGAATSSAHPIHGNQIFRVVESCRAALRKSARPSGAADLERSSFVFRPRRLLQRDAGRRLANDVGGLRPRILNNGPEQLTNIPNSSHVSIFYVC